MGLVITVLSGHRAGERIAVEGDIARIGRGPDNDIVLQRFDHVSTHHAELRREAGLWFFQDLSSTNGSAVRRSSEGGFEDLRKLHRPPVELTDGDEVHLGDPAAPVRLSVSFDQGLFQDVVDGEAPIDEQVAERNERATVRADPVERGSFEADDPFEPPTPALAPPPPPPPRNLASGEAPRPTATAPLARADGTLVPLHEALKIFTHMQINEALHRAGGDLMQASAILGIGPVELQQKLDQLRSGG
jgi:hypothetical protein